MTRLQIKAKSKSKHRLAWLILLPILATSLLGLLRSDKLIVHTSRYLGIEPEVITSPYRPAPPAWAVAADKYHSKNIIVYDLTRKQVLFRKDIDAPVPMASLTKIMTTILA